MMLVLSLVTSAQSSVLLASQGANPPLFQVFIRHLSLWLFLPPLVLLIPQIWQWTRTRLPLAGHIAVHVLLSLAVSAAMAKVMLYVARSSRQVLSVPEVLFEAAEKSVPKLLVPGVGVYWMICAVGALWRSMRTIEIERDRARRAEDRAEHLSDRLDVARFALLQRQIHPHFLFNTLNTVVGQLRSNDTESSCEVVLCLSDLLRASLQKDRKALVPLHREIELATRYLTIQKARFGERLEVSWKVTDDAAGSAVPPLLLLTLVENSIEHGLTNSEEAVRLTIEASIVGRRLSLSVLDHGPGFDLSVLERGDDGIGLRNCRERLRFLFGSEFSFQLMNRPEGGAEVRLSLPAVGEGTLFESVMNKGSNVDDVALAGGFAR
ncbi:MAG: histidine kinase [Planctomycetota bacterium]